MQRRSLLDKFSQIYEKLNHKNMKGYRERGERSSYNTWLYLQLYLQYCYKKVGRRILIYLILHAFYNFVCMFVVLRPFRVFHTHMVKSRPAHVGEVLQSLIIDARRLGRSSDGTSISERPVIFTSKSGACCRNSHCLLNVLGLGQTD